MPKQKYSWTDFSLEQPLDGLEVQLARSFRCSQMFKAAWCFYHTNHKDLLSSHDFIKPLKISNAQAYQLLELLTTNGLFKKIEKNGNVLYQTKLDNLTKRYLKIACETKWRGRPRND